MNQIWNSRDRYPSSSQYMRIEHWEIPQLFEFSVCKNNSISGLPSVDVSSFFMNREDVEYLAQALQDYLQDYDMEAEE